MWLQRYFFKERNDEIILTLLSALIASSNQPVMAAGDDSADKDSLRPVSLSRGDDVLSRASAAAAAEKQM